MDVIIRKCNPEDLIELQEISINTYRDTFQYANTEANMNAYLANEYNAEKLLSKLSDPQTQYYFLYADGHLSGYLKLNEYESQTDIYDPRSLEIEKIYITLANQGKGLGSVLLNRAIEVAAAGGKKYVWLGVWEKNYKALDFYRKNGFYQVGQHSFYMGEDEQTDFLLRKDLGE